MAFTVGEQRRDSAIGVYQINYKQYYYKFYYNNQGNAILTQVSKQQKFFNTIKTIKDRDIERELTCNVIKI